MEKQEMMRAKQIVVISGKGGTGKTVITGALVALAENKVMVDCDVDAADLHLLLKPEIQKRSLFKSGVTAFINKEQCFQCLQCVEVCRFEAINNDCVIDPIFCEGCGFCKWVCPAQAVEMKENISGELFLSKTRFGSFVHAKLGIAEENSGKLVTRVREQARAISEREKADWIIIDGSPGIGCPVIASMTGVDCALIVTEPTLSGLHDASRVVEVAKHFKVPVKVIVNKYDLNLEMTQRIEKYCSDNEIEFIGKIAFDPAVVEAMVEGKTIVEHSDGATKKALVDIWKKLQKDLTAK